MSTAQFIRNPTEVTRPVPDTLTSSILDHATVTEIGHFGLRNKEGMWVSYNCLDLMTPTAMCPDPLLSESGEYKQFKRAGWQEGFEFALYGGVECSAVGLDKADQKAEVERVFSLSEGRGIEQALLYTRFVAPGAGRGNWEAAFDILGGGAAPSLLVALALLEGHAASNYNGLPTIHMPRAAATILEANGAIKWEGDKAFTKNGSKVAIGGGYDDFNRLASGYWDLYASGEVAIEMSEKLDFQSMVLPGDGSGLPNNDDETPVNGLADNTVIAFAERMYRVTLDCYLTKISASAFTIVEQPSDGGGIDG